MGRMSPEVVRRITRRAFARGLAAAALAAPAAGSILTLNGSVFKPNGSVLNANGVYLDAATDWNNRKNAAGVTFACDFSGVNDFTLASTNGGTGRVWAPSMNSTQLAQVVKDTTDGLTNGCCLRIDKPAAEADYTTGAPEWMFPLDSTFTANSDSFGIGVPFYVEFRFKIPASRLTPSTINMGGIQAFKWATICQYSASNTAGQSFANVGSQHVLEDTNRLGIPHAYHRDFGGNYPPFLGGGTESSPAGIYYTPQNAVDRGAGVSAHADRYCEVPSPFTTASPGCEFWPIDEWMTFLLRILPANYSGGPGNEFDLYMARAGVQQWTHLIHEVDYSLGDPNENGGGFVSLNGGHLLTYESQRLSSTVDTWHKYDQVLVSLNQPAIPLDSGVPA